MGLGFRVGKGVRVYGGGRGLGVSVGVGPVRYYSRVGGGGSRRRPSGTSRASAAAYERQVRQAERMQEVQVAVDLDQQLLTMCQVHQEVFEPAEKPTAPTAKAVDRGALRAQLESEAVRGISPLKLGVRRAARKVARGRLDGEVLAEEARREEEVAVAQRARDESWTQLQENSPDAVLPALEQAFEDNEAPAAAVSCRDDRVDIVMRWSGLDDLVSERKAGVTPGGKPTIHKRSKGERTELYLDALCSHALVTAKEAFAVCPKVEQVGLAIVRTGTDPARGDVIVEPILLAVVTRGDFDQIRWDSISATAALLNCADGKIGMRGKGTNKALFGLDLADSPEERQFVAEVAVGLDARVPEDGIGGIPLPVRVVAD